MLSENERWLLSYYRASEITGAMFFGRIAKMQRPGPVQADLTMHFADEAQHARWFTECMESLSVQPLKLNYAYQDDYLQTAGVPTNFMEILSITQAFEKRILNTYAKHLRVPGTPMPVKRTLQRIMRDEKWHVEWIKQSLRDMEAEYGKEHIERTLDRHTAADRETYRRFVSEHAERIDFLLQVKGERAA
ncbi:MAG TPA: ferritin-like domain-containing protein [Polyangiaceae bacterium]|nr:ferritin-like domain-containing protein [Polyangiaceae bacterium]